MARYVAINEKNETVVQLELDGYIGTPDYWPEENHPPEGWPYAAVEALVHLFTGQVPHQAGQTGVEIPDCLGWHIATLMDDFAAKLHSIGDTLGSYFTVSTPTGKLTLSEIFEMELPEHIDRTTRSARLIAEKNELLSEFDRREVLTRHVREWYGQGLELYRIWREFPPALFPA